MHADHHPRSVRRPARVGLTAAALAGLVLTGLVVGPAPGGARAALVATGVNDSYTVKHDRLTTIGAPGVLGNDLNLLGGATAILVSDVAHGSLSLQSNGGFSYTPASGYVGSDSFRYRPSGTLSSAATVTITVTNAAPVANPDSYTWPGGRLVVPAPGVLANDGDADADALMAQLNGGGASGSLELGSDGSIRYTPGGGFSGSATFSYRAWDGIDWSGLTTVTLTRTPASTPTPTPTPPTPTPSPTPTPLLPLPTLSPLPTPLPSLPLPLPSDPLPSDPLPSDPLPTAPPTALPTSSRDPGPTPTPAARPAPSTSPSSGGASPGAAPPGGVPPSGSGGSLPSSPGAAPRLTGGGSGSASGLPTVRFDEARLELGTGPLDVFAGIEVWAVPAATIAVPGLLVVLWIALQAAGAIAWVPAARRLRADRAPAFAARRRRR